MNAVMKEGEEGKGGGKGKVLGRRKIKEEKLRKGNKQKGEGRKGEIEGGKRMEKRGGKRR